MDDVERALDLWIALTGVDPEATTRRGWHEITVGWLNEELKESLQLPDPSHLTTLLLLDHFTTALLKDQSFTVVDLLTKQDKVAAYLKQARDLYTVLRSPKMQSQVAEFQGWLREALRHYGVENEAVFRMVESEDDLAILRRDALRSLERLEVHQFTQGEAALPGKVHYVTRVHEWWNVNSLLRAMLSDATMSGISLNVIRDPLKTSSYFAFAIRNGETLSLLTDRPNEVHPLSKYMARRPDRDLARRIVRHHFPYELLDIAVDEDGAYFYEQDTEEVAIYQPQVHPLREIKDLEPDEVIWTVMLFALIEERFWKQGFRTKELSYTGEMVVRRDVLDAGTTALAIPARARGVLEVPKLTAADVTTDKMLDDWARRPTQENRWLEERYAHLVPEELLNLAGDGARVPMLMENGEVRSTTLPAYLEATSHSSVFWRGDVGRRLAALDGTTFGSRERLVSEQRWMARYNQAVVIGREAEREYKARKDEVLGEYRRRVEGNAQRLLDAIARGERTERVAGYPFLQMETPQEWLHDYGVHPAVHMPKPPRTGPYPCYVTGGRASMAAVFRPQTVEDLAFLCGCGVGDLPDVLQHWDRQGPYGGNSLLERLDPMDWAAVNPWREMPVDVEIFLGKQAYNRLRKDLGLPVQRFPEKREA